MSNDEDAVIWLRPEVTGRGRPPGYSRAQLAQAAIAVADAEGLEAASMRRVAAEIGAGPMSLYRYVRNKGELHLLMADELVRQEWEGLWAGLPADDWALTLRRVAGHLRDLVLGHPWWAEVMAQGVIFGPNLIRVLESVLAGLDGLGLDIDEMMEIAEIVQLFAIGQAQRDYRTQQSMAAVGATEPVQTYRDWTPYIMSLIQTGRHPYLERIVIDARAPHESNARVLFDRALDRLIAGIAATLPAR